MLADEDTLAGRASIYPLLALYGASSATTTFACIATILKMPDIQQSEIPRLLASYVPFLLMPLCMTLDLGTRLTGMASRVDRVKIKTM